MCVSLCYVLQTYAFIVFLLIAKRIYKSHCELSTRGDIYCRSSFSRDSAIAFFTVRGTCWTSIVREVDQYASGSGASHVQYVGGWDQMGISRCTLLSVAILIFWWNYFVWEQGEPYRFTHLIILTRVYHLSEEEESELANSAPPTRPSRPHGDSNASKQNKHKKLQIGRASCRERVYCLV